MKKQNIESIIEYISDKDNFNFSYIVRDKRGDLCLLNEKPRKRGSLEVIDLDKYAKVFTDFDFSRLLEKRQESNEAKENLQQNVEILCNLRELADFLAKNNMTLPYKFAQDLEAKAVISDFIEQSNFLFFKNELPDINERLSMYSEEERRNFYKFANAIGCFRKEHMKDREGNEKESLVAQKACSLLSNLINSGTISLGSFESMFFGLGAEVKVDQEFLDFASVQSGNKRFKNVELLVDLDDQYMNLFSNVISDFKTAASHRKTSNLKGNPIIISWKEAFKRYNLQEGYGGVDADNIEMARIFEKRSVPQDKFDLASKVLREAKENNTPEHLLGKPLAEKSPLEQVEEIKRQTDQTLLEAKDSLEEGFNNNFSYEWLNKYDPDNFILGIYLNCCATITYTFYGKDIAINSVKAKDLQTLIIRNNNGEIVGKGTLYLNKEHGYAVINGFEIDVKYRKHRDNSRYTVGFYKDGEGTEIESRRQEIFDSFMRGINAFIEEYDKQNPDNPLKQVNVGFLHNKLKRQVEKFEKA